MGGRILIGVVTHEYASITYLLEVKPNETVVGGDELRLEHGETWEQSFFFEATRERGRPGGGVLAAWRSGS